MIKNCIKESFFLVLILLGLVSCQKEPAVILVTGVSLNKTNLLLTEGETSMLVATVLPEEATNKNVRWSSGSPDIATVNNGAITAIKEGYTTITVRTEDGGKTAICTVTVSPKYHSVTGISLDKTSVEMTEDEELSLTATIYPENATNKNVKWSSSDETIATVTNGLVTAIKAGNATITVTAEDGGKTASCSITVKPKYYPVTGVTLDRTSLEMKEGEVFSLNATVEPQNATNKNVKWSSSDETIAYVQNGIVTALKEGNVTITAETEDGNRTALCNISIQQEIIVFEDKNVERVCVSYFDINGDGKLSKSEASRVWSLKSQFFGDFAPVVTSFAELQYFTALREIPDSCFFNCPRLTKVTLPQSVTSIGNYACSLCESLNEINLTDRITRLGVGIFTNCLSLSSCFIPKSITSIPDGLYWYCPAITELHIPETVTTIGSYAFCTCTGIKEIIVPNSVKSIDVGAFSACRAAETIHISDNIVSLKSMSFSHSGARIIVIPEGVLSTEKGVFGYSPQLEEITIPSTMLVMGNICSRCPNLKTVYCKAETPPELSSAPFTIYDDKIHKEVANQNVTIYVPTNSVEKYKTADYWKEYADKIVGKEY